MPCRLPRSRGFLHDGLTANLHKLYYYTKYTKTNLVSLLLRQFNLLLLSWVGKRGQELNHAEESDHDSVV